LIRNSINDSNVLDENVQTLELEYIDWFCACANWTTQHDIKKYKDQGKLSDHCIFIEQLTQLLIYQIH